MLKDSLKVMAFPAFRNKLSNPYNHLLNSSIEQADQSIQISEFSFGAALTQKVDIIHVHWPEVYASSKYRLKAYTYTFMILFVLWAAKLKGSKIVWTIHNLRPHNVKYPLLDSILWPTFMRLVDGICSLSTANEAIALKAYPTLCTKAKISTYHGLYDSVKKSTNTQTQARQHLQLPVQGQLFLSLGQIKPYKGIEKLITAFKQPGMSDHTLVVAGKALDTTYVAELKKLIENTGNIIFRPGFVTDDDLPEYYKAAHWSVIPFDAIFNSGSTLMSLTHHTPVILPYSDNFAEYSNFLPDQLLLYHGDFNVQVLLDALERFKTDHPTQQSSQPVNSALSWSDIGAKTAGFYRQLCQI